MTGLITLVFLAGGGIFAVRAATGGLAPVYHVQARFSAAGQGLIRDSDVKINGVNVGRYLQTYSKRDLGPRFGFAYDLNGSGKTMIRGGFGVFWNFTPGGTSSSKGGSSS